MKSILVICVAMVTLQTIHGQVIRSVAPNIIGGIGGCGCNTIPACPSTILAPTLSTCSSMIAPPCSSSIVPSWPPALIPQPINAIVQPSVAATLADTLALLTVSSLLAETLPLSPNVVVAPPCGCNLGCGYGGYYY